MVDWIEKELNGEQMQECEVVVPGAPWSPAKVIKTDLGWELLLGTASITIDNLMDKTL